MQSKILFCLLVLGLGLQLNNGSDEVKSLDQESSEETKEIFVEPAASPPVETTTITPQEQIQNTATDSHEDESEDESVEIETTTVNNDAVDDSFEEEDDEDEMEPETTTTVLQDQEEEEDFYDEDASEEEPMTSELETTTKISDENEIDPGFQEEDESIEEISTTEATTTPDSHLWESSEEEEEEEETTPETTTTTASIPRDEYRVKVRLTDLDESSEEIMSNEDLVDEKMDSENLSLKKGMATFKTPSKETKLSLKIINVASALVDRGLAQLEKSQEKLNETLRILSSQKQSLINYLRFQNGKTLNDEENRDFILSHGFDLKERIRQTITSLESIIESTERLSAIISKFIEHCRGMNVEQRRKGKNCSNILSIVKKMQNLERISSNDGSFSDYFEQNKNVLDDLNVDVEDFIISSVQK